MVSNIKKKTEQKVLSLWSTKSEEPKLIAYREIINTLKNNGASERSVARYLSILVKEKKLEKVENGYKKTFYRPEKNFWNNLKSENQLELSEESLNRIGSYIMKILISTIDETGKITQKIYKSVWEEISSKTKAGKDTTEIFDKAIDNVLKETTTEEEIKEFHALLGSLIKGCLSSLADRTVHARLITEEELPSIIEDNIWNLVREYMALWVFLYKHPSVVSELARVLADSNSRANKSLNLKKLALLD